MLKKYSILILVLCSVAFSAIGQESNSYYRRGHTRTHGDTVWFVHELVPYKPDTIGQVKWIIDSVKITADTTLRHQLTIKINPGLLFTEQGLLLHYNFNNNFGIELGYGINEDNSGNSSFHTYDGSGYTIRWGLLQYLDTYKHWWFALEGFYRYYGNINAVADHSAGFTQGIDDEVINPLRTNITNINAGDGNQVDVYTASGSVVCFDAVVGYECRHKHFVFDAFAGAGSRSKNMKLHLTGYYSNAIGVTDDSMLPYSTIQSKAISNSYPDVKLGFTLGYRFY